MTADEILRRIAKQRPGLETMRHCSLVLPYEHDVVDAVLQELDHAQAAGLLDDVASPPPDFALLSDLSKQAAERA